VTTVTAPPFTARLDVSGLSVGEHTLRVVARDLRNPPGSFVDEITFFIAQAEPSADADGNGLPDEPGAVLTEDGDTWVALTTDPDTDETRSSRVRRFEPGDGELRALATHPDFPGFELSVRVPRAVLREGEIGLVIVSLAPDTITLLGLFEAEQLSLEPGGGILEDSPYAEVSVLVSTDGGSTFNSIDPARLTDNNVRVSFLGIAPDEGNTAVFAHATTAFAGAGTPLNIQVVENDGWLEDTIVGLDFGSDFVTARLNGLSVIAPFFAQPDSAAIRVTPAQHLFGRVPVGMTAQAVFTVSNVGSGFLEGSATTTAPFSIVSGGSYSLTPGQSQEVTVAFTPLALEDYQEELVFTGGGGASRTLFGTGARAKVFQFLGCGDVTGDAAPWGNLLVAALVLALLYSARRKTAGE